MAVQTKVLSFGYSATLCAHALRNSDRYSPAPIYLERFYEIADVALGNSYSGSRLPSRAPSTE